MPDTGYNNNTAIAKIALPANRYMAYGVLSLFFLIGYSVTICAETIYEWTDPWGQRQYSKTPVPGSMVSELTELPEIVETTEQQKQQAMFQKLQQMRQANMIREREKTAEKQQQEQRIDLQSYCMQLQHVLTDVQLNHARDLALSGYYFFPNNYYAFIEHDINREIRKNCR